MDLLPFQLALLVALVLLVELLAHLLEDLVHLVMALHHLVDQLALVALDQLALDHSKQSTHHHHLPILPALPLQCTLHRFILFVYLYVKCI